LTIMITGSDHGNCLFDRKRMSESTRFLALEVPFPPQKDPFKDQYWNSYIKFLYREHTDCRKVVYRSEQSKNSSTKKMRRKIDTVTGRTLYRTRLATGEPPFAHIRPAIGLDGFT